MLLGLSISLVGLIWLITNTVLFVKNKAVRKKVSKTFIVYLIALSITEVLCHVIGVLKPNSNFFLSHFYFIFQFVFISYLYYTLFNDKKIKQGILFLFVCELGLVAYSYISNPSVFWEFNDLEIISTSILLVIFALFFVYKNLEKVHDYFNFSMGLVMYLMCSIFIFLTGNTELVFLKEPYIDIWLFNSVFYILFQFMIFREYLHLSKKTTVAE